MWRYVVLFRLRQRITQVRIWSASSSRPLSRQNLAIRWCTPDKQLSISDKLTRMLTGKQHSFTHSFIYSFIHLCIGFICLFALFVYLVDYLLICLFICLFSYLFNISLFCPSIVIDISSIQHKEQEESQIALTDWPTENMEHLQMSSVGIHGDSYFLSERLIHKPGYTSVYNFYKPGYINPTYQGT